MTYSLPKSVLSFLLLPMLAGGFCFGGFMASASTQSLTITQHGATTAKILVEEGAKENGMPPEPPKTKKKVLKVERPPRFAEWKAANDLAHYIEKMSGARPEVITDGAAIKSALAGSNPVFVVGELALKVRPDLKKKLESVAHSTKFFDKEAILLNREGNKVFLAGLTDASHYFAVATLLQDWGCRWYLPTAIGEVIPEHKQLEIEQLDKTYSPPFEVRSYWLAFNASKEGLEDFQLRNFFNNNRILNNHTFARLTKELIPEGGQHFNVPITDPKTIELVVDKIDADFAAGKQISVSVEPWVYRSDYTGDIEARVGIEDKYFLAPSMSEAFWVFYHGVAKKLQDCHPDAKGSIGFLGLMNNTLPPQGNLAAEKSLILVFAPMDFDPNHSLIDIRSPMRLEFAGILRRWAEIMHGRVVIHDYDQSMRVWRDIPNPSHQVFRHDVKFYRDLGIMGVDTESRGAIATVFTNLFFRGQLLWNPDVDVDALMEEFYTGFYGPLAAPMKAYWNAIYKAWEDTMVLEHEYFVIPAIYTPALVKTLRENLIEAEKAAASLKAKAKEARSERENLYLERLAFTQKSFQLIDLYTQIWKAAAEDVDYQKAATLGQEMIKARLEMAETNPTFTTRVIGASSEPSELKAGIEPAWLPGEIQQYVEIAKLTNGTEGKLITKLPLEWAFRRDPHDTGLARNFARDPADLTFWQANKDRFVTSEQKKDYPTTEWEMIRVDQYAQAQGILHPDWQSFTGYMWYKTSLDVVAKDLKGSIHLLFPGLFSEAWLYINGELIAHREQSHLWWDNSYRFDWDVDISGKLKAGKNDITLRVYNTHHNGGMFRRPFIYQALTQK